MSDDDRKTWVFPIVGFSTDLCVQFSERMRSMMRSFGMDFFFFLVAEAKDRMARESFRALIPCRKPKSNDNEI